MTRLLLTRGSVLTVEEERPVAKDDNNEQCNEPSWLGPYGETVVVIRLYARQPVRKMTDLRSKR